MFLVLIEYTVAKGKEWVTAKHDSVGLRSTFPTREMAEEFAMEFAKVHSGRVAVIEIKSWYQQEVPPARVVEKRIG